MSKVTDQNEHHPTTAVILAAGQARRMGQAKQLLPWGDSTVLGQTIANARQSHAADVLVVTGHMAEAVEAIAQAAGVATIYNPAYAAGEMLSSLQTAVRHLPPTSAAILVMLADQPMIEARTLNLLIDAFEPTNHDLIAPTWNGRRGNPVLIGQRYFEELLALPPGDAPRTLLRRHSQRLHLLPVSTDTVLRDLDTPEAYARWRPTTG